MILSARIWFLVYCIFCFFLQTQCKKEIPNNPGGTPKVINNQSQSTTPFTAKEDSILVGNGSGSILIDGTTTQINTNNIIIIRGGTYSSITIQNIHGADSLPIRIVNKGLVNLMGAFNDVHLNNCSNVILSGNGTPGIQKGFFIHDNSFRGLTIQGKVRNVTVQNIAFKNIGDYSIYAFNSMPYAGNDSSIYINLKILNCSFDYSGGITFGGDVSNGNITGLSRNIEMAHDSITNSNWGTVVFSGACDGYNIHDNYFNNINLNLTNHNSAFLMVGNGSFYRNYIGTHQGMALRAWTLSFSNYTPKSVLIYNNINLNSLKYSSFEVQSFSNYMIPGKTTYSNAYIFHNTSGNLNSNHDWFSNIVDIYDLVGGTVRLDNNLGFNFYPVPGTGIFYNLSPPLESSGNLYYNTSSDAGFDPNKLLLNPNSPIKLAGVPDSVQVTDFYNRPRNPTSPTVGAIE